MAFSNIAWKDISLISLSFSICFFIHRFAIEHLYNDLARLPTIRYKWFLPDFINKFAFCFNAQDQIVRGYIKHKDRAFRLLTTDGDLVVLPLKYLWGIEQVPANKLSAFRARHRNLLGEYTEVVGGSANVSRAIEQLNQQNRLRIAAQFSDEFHKALCIEVPRCQYKWISPNIYKLVLKLVSRATARFTVGDDLCRNGLWLEAVPSYTTDILATIILLRPVPQFLRPIVARVLPSLRRARKQARWAQQELLIPMIESRRYKEVNETDYQKPDDLLQWIMDTAESNFDRDPANIAKALMSTIALSIVHPITNLVTHAVYDVLMQTPYIGPLRAEIEEMLDQGELDADELNLVSRSHQHLMDGFLRESLRWNPLSELNPQYILTQPHTFADSTPALTLPSNTRICFPAGPLSRDPAFIPHAHRFDAFRWTRDPREVLPILPAEAADPRIRHAVAFHAGLAHISPVNLHFGWGRAACPGRDLAVRIASAALSQLLVQYDMRFFPGQVARPLNTWVGEMGLPSRGFRVLMRERGRSE
ncbi:cytochrome P450 [Aspergillus homomorphus CBS 101889]|uniref:Putative cytochrome P450 monooxygenase SirB-like protein n=1 Tax=Aspergillus homomorphus (strain CBS 101889) TaxID=1450537 RepID=A0A395HP46_ASPHC|nr:putative cytochrome P450 monooxygenase SirB-like protein [Aspergillus homomorphus CBS 101889]RAL09203.1 putative cytochrome P450 monooxygenase SirB-like protein [Aspergillus homomorphus CBS 101889]